jgi:hypothetical protein
LSGTFSLDLYTGIIIDACAVFLRFHILLYTRALALEAGLFNPQEKVNLQPWGDSTVGYV